MAENEDISQKTDDSSILLQAIDRYIEDSDLHALYQKCLPLKCDDFRLHYLVSHYHRDNNNLKEALIELEKCIDSLENNITENGKINRETSRLLRKVENAIPQRKVWYYAGETFAMARESDKSLDALKKWQIESKLESVYEEYLYSFRKFNEHSLSDLINQEITVSHPSEFNDPFDTLVQQWLECISKRNKKPHIKPYTDSFDYYRIRSFSRDTPSNKAYRNIQMWSLYAQDHKGFCIKYKFWPDFTSNDNHEQYLTFRPAQYILKSKKEDVTNSTINLDKAFCAKQANWRYENEIRLIAYLPNEKPNKHFCQIPLGMFCSIDSIYFGINCPEKNISTIQEICRKFENRVKFYKMGSDPHNVYKLRPSRVICKINE